MSQDLEILLVEYSLEEGPLLKCALQRILQCGPLSKEQIVRYRTYLCSQKAPYLIFEAACQTGDVPILQWLVKRHSLTREDLFIYPGFCQAATKGHVHVLQWLQEFGLTVEDLRDTTSCLPAVARNGHVLVLQWLKEFGITFKNDPHAFASAFFGAQLNGHADVVKLLTKLSRCREMV